MFVYVEEKDLGTLFSVIYKHYTKRETVPDYFVEKEGMKRLIGVMVGVKMDNFYPDIFSKSTYLLTQINKGHFFSNGNKRMALVLTLVFAFINSYWILARSKDEYKKELEMIFPNLPSFEDYQDFSPEEFGYYNLSIIIADSNKYDLTFEDLKEKTMAFLKFSLIRI
ncbi:MAG: Fic family protein [Candidatus Jorgensenbacteria bacterium]|nr:Fic family protein [Candidatus Jorgensenbacteria bacterium]